jgi:integrase
VKEAKGIYKRGRIFWYKWQENGERRYVSLETDDPIEALTRARQVKGSPIFQASQGLRRDMERYLSVKRDLNVHSRATERVTRAALMEFASRVGDVQTDRVLASAASVHYARLQSRVAETTAQIHMRALRAFFSWAVKERIILQSPFAALKLAKIDRYARLRFCTAAQRDTLIKEAPSDDLRFILFAGFHCGMRKNEIIEARIDWFDLGESGAVHIKNTDTFRIKDRETRFVPLTGQFRDFLRVYLKDKGGKGFALKPAVKHGKGTYRYDFHRPYNDYMVAQEMRWATAHVMRHTFASLLVQAGVSIFKVARWMGDGVEVVEKHYAHLAPQDRDIERMLVAT